MEIVAGKVLIALEVIAMPQVTADAAPAALRDFKVKALARFAIAKVCAAEREYPDVRIVFPGPMTAPDFALEVG
jgi:hypothetical protein